MKKFILAIAVGLAILSKSYPADAITYDIFRLTNNGTEEGNVVVSGYHVAWEFFRTQPPAGESEGSFSYSGIAYWDYLDQVVQEISTPDICEFGCSQNFYMGVFGPSIWKNYVVWTQQDENYQG